MKTIKKLLCVLIICCFFGPPCRAVGPRIGLTDTVYQQFRVVLKELGATPVDLVTDASMAAYFTNIIDEWDFNLSLQPETYKPYDINVWKIYHWVCNYDGFLATSGEQDTDTWVRTSLDSEIWRWRWEHRDAPKPLVLASEDFLRTLINLEAVEAAVQRIDGLLIGGGQGVNPRLYGYNGIPPFRGYKTRDIIEIAFIYAALKYQKPILGICRGAQVLAVALGSELTIDLSTAYDYEGLGDRHYHANEVEDAKGHDIVVLPESELAGILGLKGPGPHVINVNSYHMHAVLKPAPLISVQAYDYSNTKELEKNIIEGFVHREGGQFAVGVQWHPERPVSETGERARLVFEPERFFPRPHDRALFDSFLAAANKEPAKPKKEKKPDHFGIWSVLPAFAALVLAIATRHVILSLIIGVFGGMIVYNGGNVFKGLVDFIELGPFAQLARESNARVIIIISIIGGFVYLVEQSGGMKSFARKITSFVDTPFKAQLSVWMAGLAIFFTDSGNSLILGPLFRPIFKNLKICREKLAFILDSTSSPVCVLIPVISWGIYIMSLIEQSFTPLGLTESPLSAFANILPFQFYPLLAIVTVPIMAFIGKEYGPMARFQRAALEAEETGNELLPASHQGAQAGARAVFLPLGTMLAVAFSLFAYFYLTLGALPGKQIQTSLVIAYMSGAIVCAAILKMQNIYSVKQSFELFLKGISRVVFIIIVLLLAWSMGDVCKLLHTGDFIARFFGDFLKPALLPAVVFVLGAVISLSTGSSWGTFALLMPIAIPVAHGIGAPLYVTIASVLSGGMLGDHASPISDTTILSSMSSGCEHADHVNTQLPYACVTGLSALITFLLAGFTTNIYSLLVGLVIHGVLLISITGYFGEAAHDLSKE